MKQEKNISEPPAAKIKCIALDLDRTTLTTSKGISPVTREALQRVISSGIHVIVASGRAFAALPQDILDIKGIQYAITGNGASMVQIPSGKCLKRTVLSRKAVEKILCGTCQEPVIYEAFIGGTGYASTSFVMHPEQYGITGQGIAYIRRTRKPVDNIVDFLRTNGERLDSMDMLVLDEKRISPISAWIKKEVPDIYLTSSIKNLLEVSNKDAGKHSGVRFFSEYLGISPEEIAAFGDADNDVDMLRYVGYGVAMANASENCKAAADYITKSNDEDGVAYALEHILHII